jgi:hypothetical protein
MIVSPHPALHAQILPVGQAPAPAAAVALSPSELDSLIAPIALYPDPLLSQVLVACTYPLEVVQAAQFLQQNPSLTGPALENAARQENWDPSVQALIVFPDVLRMLSGNVQWATNLGNAFLTQQADVMQAVQRMRVQAQNSGVLTSSPQMTVTTQSVAGAAPAVVIQPASPQVLYVPVYDPVFIWGPPIYPYPVLWYPPVLIRRGMAFGLGVTITAWFGGWGGWSGWGWGPNWYSRTVIVNNAFFYRYGYRRPAIGVAATGPGVWAHDPLHRWGVPYPSHPMTVQYAASARPFAIGRPIAVAPPSSLSVSRVSPVVRGYERPSEPARIIPERSLVPNNVVRNGYVSQPRPTRSYEPVAPGRSVHSNGAGSRAENRGEQRRSK